MAQATYSAAALAAAVGVPRTTINDWLSRYEDYIDSISVGKRKVYSEESLKILQEIASLRDSGKSSAEIEAVLAGKHGVKPEVASEEPSRTAVSAEPAPAAAPAPVAAKLVSANGEKVLSPFPGLIKNLLVAEGATVKKDQPILVLEAMKMDNDITAPCDGVVSFQVQKGANVESDAVLAVIG